LTRRLVDSRSGVLAALSFMLLPAVTWMGGEGRSVAMATTAATLAMLLFIVALEHQRTVWWILYGLSLVLSATISVLTIPIFFSLPLAMLVSGCSRRQWVGFAASSAVAGVVMLPVLMKVVSQQHQVSWVGEPSVKGLLAYPREVWFPNQGSDLYVVLAWLLILAAMAGFVAAGRRDRWRTRHPLGQRGVMVLLTGWLLLPGIILIGWSLLGTDLYVPRYLMPTAPALGLISGLALGAIRLRWWALVGVLVQVAVLAPPWLDQRQVAAMAPTSLIADGVSSRLQPGDALLFVNGGKHGWARLARHAYPDAFGTAPDLTLAGPAEDSPSVAETTVSLSEVPDRLVGVERVITVVAGDPTERGRADIQTVREAGFVQIESVEVGGWSIRTFVR
jgi:mannosyltransferase